MQTPSMTRLFLVGCPRSGTTLLQSLLAAHPQIVSFPESHFFTTIISSRVVLRKLGIASRRARTRFTRFLATIGHEEMQSYLPRFAVLTRHYAQAFTDILDTLTRRQNKHIWLEKTPKHLLYIDDITRLVPEAKFIHLVRNGADVVASLYEVAQAHPAVWRSGSTSNLDQCIERWVQSVRVSQRYLGAPQHIIVRYEQLVEVPHIILNTLCRFVGVPFDEHMLAGYRESAKKLVLPYELWKQSVTNTIENANQKKFCRLFDEDQRKYIHTQIAQVNLEELNSIPVDAKMTEIRPLE
jgi:hypothetical protein